VVSESTGKSIIEIVTRQQSICCHLDDGSALSLPLFLGRFVRRADILRIYSPHSVLVERSRSGNRIQCLLYSAIGYVAQPRLSENGAGFLARVELPERASGPKAMFLSGDCVRRYFYTLDGKARSLYALLDVSEIATLADLRTVWRVRELEAGLATGDPAGRPRIERAFNILAHPELRNCYEALRRDEDAPPVFPYGGFGSILVEGRLSNDGMAFFADRILAYKPEMHFRKASLLIRQCEFLADRVICRDRRRNLEVWLDAALLPGINWDLTWKHWKHWLRTRIDVDATFVRTGKYRLHKGEWTLRTWLTALPSRLRVSVPNCVTADIERAKAIHTLLGEHADLVGKIRAEVEKQPVEHVRIQEWFDQLAASTHLKPQHVTWHPDYEPYYFEQLRKRSATWFLFREEYLFAWRMS